MEPKAMIVILVKPAQEKPLNSCANFLGLFVGMFFLMTIIILF